MRHSVAAAKGILECSVKDILVSGQGVRPAVFAKYSAISRRLDIAVRPSRTMMRPSGTLVRLQMWSVSRSSISANARISRPIAAKVSLLILVGLIWVDSGE